MRSFRSRRDNPERRTREMGKTHKVLLLGLSESGKSTIMKQMCAIHQGGFCHDARISYRETIYSNLLESAQAVAAALRKFGVELVDPSTMQALKLLLEYDPNAQSQSSTYPSSFTFPTQIAKAIHRLWKDRAVPEFVDDYRSKFYLMDNAPYFFTEVRRIASANYVPTMKDILQCRQRSTGIVGTRVSIPTLSLHLSEVSGQLNQPMEWMHRVEPVTTVLFCVALSDYDRISTEEKGQNRLAVSLAFFDVIINSQWRLDISFILVLNKIDIFRHKLPKVPLERHFQEYSDGPNVDDAVKYILRRFLQTNRAKRSVYPHIGQATDDTMFGTRLIPIAVSNTVIRNSLKAADII